MLTIILLINADMLAAEFSAVQVSGSTVLLFGSLDMLTGAFI